MHYLLTGINNVVLGLARVPDGIWEYAIVGLYQSSKVYAETPAKQGYPVLLKPEVELEFTPEQDFSSVFTGTGLECLVVVFDDEGDIASHEGRVHLWSVQVGCYAIDAEFAQACAAEGFGDALKELVTGLLKRQAGELFDAIELLQRRLAFLREQGWTVDLEMVTSDKTAVALNSGVLKAVASREHEGRTLVYQGEQQIGN